MSELDSTRYFGEWEMAGLERFPLVMRELSSSYLIVSPGCLVLLANVEVGPIKRHVKRGAVVDPCY